jgi:hypothetical protein
MSDHDFGYLSRAGIEFATLIPTETGLAKSIMDATGPFREFLHASGYHCYATQFQGQEAAQLFICKSFQAGFGG